MPVDIQALYPKLIHLMLDTIFVVDSDNKVVFVSNACEALLGYEANEMIGTQITNYMHPEDLPSTYDSIKRVMSGEYHINFRNRYIHKNGDVVFIRWSARWYEDEGVRIGVARNVTDLQKAEDELQFQAHHDPLTGLPNRLLFNDRLQSALNAAKRHKNKLALLFIDLNDFKSINDVHGHAVGDQVLSHVADRLKGCMRATDTIARMGGDEFTVLLTDIQSADAVAVVINQIKEVMTEPPSPGLHGLVMPSCSIGVAVYPEHGEDADALLSHADTTMYEVKRRRSAIR